MMRTAMQGGSQLTLALVLSGLLAGCPGGSKKIECGPPIAAAGEDLEGVTGQRIILRGSFRLPPEDEPTCQNKLDGVTFQWEQTAGPVDVTIDGADQVEASFVANLLGDYSFRCKAIFSGAANPEQAESQWDTLNVHVAPRFCGPPVANAGADQLLPFEGQPVSVSLDGSQSHATATCPDLELVSLTWSVLEQPAGADAQLTAGAAPGLASFAAEVPGTYRLQLEVRDSLGSDGREDTATDSVQIELVERSPCEATLDVTVLASPTGTPIAGAHVRVVDEDNTPHTADSGPDGVASFAGLAPGRRPVITVWTDETVAALPGSGDPDPRPRHQVVSVLQHCAGQITIPVPLTESGRAAQPSGVVTAKLSQELFDALPHSQKYAGACGTDADCAAGYRCADTPLGDTQCTPRTLLPVFGLDDPNISGQFRGFLLMPVLPRGNMTRFPVSALMAPPPSPEAFLPGNMATDDPFLNGLAPGLGLDVWGEACSSVTDCPDSVGYACEQDDQGQRRCRDLTPMYNLRLTAPAGQDVPLVLLGAVVNVGMENLLPILATFLTAGSENLVFDVGGLLGAFRLRTLHACIVTVDVPEDGEVDISAQLAGLDLADCWSVPYEQQEAVVPIPNPSVYTAGNACAADADCGWPGENLRCLAPAPATPAERYCLVPLYRVSIVTEQEITLEPTQQDPSPLSAGYDTRLCENLPAQGQYQKMCPGPDNQPLACDPPVFCQAPPPADTQCGLPYGLAVLAADFAPGHDRLPAGGRVVLGFRFNLSPFSTAMQPRFLAPSLGDMQAESLAAVQLLFRNLWLLPDGSYQVLAGRTAAAAAVEADTRSLDLPVHPAWPSVSAPPPDPGLSASATFIPEDPLAECGQSAFARVFATALGLLEPQSGQNDLPASVSLQGTDQALVALSLARVDRSDDGEGKVLSYPDTLWLIYAPSGSQDLALPLEPTRFEAGDEVWITPAQASFAAPFDYDLFPAGMLMGQQSGLSSDAFQTVAP